MKSPFEGKSIEDFREIRDDLIDKHPLKDEILDIVLESWEKLKQTRIGPPDDDIKLFREIHLSTQALGQLLEVLIGRHLQKQCSGWRLGEGSEKDFTCVDNNFFSIELKCSGQGKAAVFGNRSYTQDGETDQTKKEKNGYYITVNFFDDKIYLVRFGWIDLEDWKGQAAASGQMASLDNDTYENKLKALEGDYMNDIPLLIVNGIGKVTQQFINETFGTPLKTVRDYKEITSTESGTKLVRDIPKLTKVKKDIEKRFDYFLEKQTEEIQKRLD